MHDRFFLLALLVERHAVVVHERGVARLLAEQFLVFVARLGKAAGRREGIRKVHVDRRHVRRHAAGLGKLLDRGVHLALRPRLVAPLGEGLGPRRERGAEVVVRLAEVRPQPRGVLKVEVGAIHVAAGKLLGPEPIVGLPGLEVVLERVFPHVVFVHPADRSVEGENAQRGHHERPASQERRLRFLLGPFKPRHRPGT